MSSIFLGETESSTDRSGHVVAEPLKENSYIHTDEIVKGLQNSETDINSHERHKNESESSCENHKDINTTVDDVTAKEELTNNLIIADDNILLDSIKVETVALNSSHSDQQSENEDIPDHNEYILNHDTCFNQVNEEGHLNNSISEKKDLEDKNAKPQIAVKLRERKRKCNIQQGIGSKVKTDARLRRKENSKQKLQSLEESSIESAIGKLNGSGDTSISAIKQDKEEGHLKHSVTEDTCLEVKSKTKLKLVAKLRERQLKCQIPQDNGSKYNTSTRKRKRGNSKKHAQPKEESSIASANGKESDPEDTSLSAIKGDRPTVKKMKSRKRNPNLCCYKKESVHCDLCQHTFKTRGFYERHLAYDKCRHDCKVCGKVFLGGQTYLYKDHLMTHEKVKDSPDQDTKAFLCNKCGLGFDAKKRLKRHMARSHSDRKYACSICSKVLTSSSGLHYHFKRHHKTDSDHLLPCPICGKLFTERYIMTKHEATHRTEKKFKCDKCPAAFTRELYLKEHQRRHTRDYSHICSECGAGFYSKKNLKSHQSAKHSWEKNYSCTLCGSKFSYDSSLRNHMRKHSGVKKYECKECDAAFIYSSSLYKHVKMHEREMQKSKTEK